MVKSVKLCQGDGKGVAELDVSTITPEGFWAAHIAARKPALIRGHPTDLSWRASSLWTEQYLTSKAGGASVLVEVRGDPEAGYGRGVKRRMTFGEFVGRMAAGETGLYLTAQQVGVAPDGHPMLMAEPLLSLAGAPSCGVSSSDNGGGGGRNGRRDGGSSSSVATGAADFPASLEMAGHLVPQSLNLWMGAAPEGSSSGLHHDFHDNIYVHLRGRKRFRLYPPDTAPTMYTYGKLARLYDNGRIVYEGQGDVLPDGTDAADVARWRRRTEAEAAVAEAEAAVARGESGAQARLERSEAALEAALEAELSDMLEEGEEEEEDDGDDVLEDSDEEEEGEGEEDGKRGPRRRGNDTGAAAAATGKQDGDGLIVDPETPPSFSRVPLGDSRVSDAQLAADFPRFPGRAAALEVTVEAGNMLYLPAGWFHEVTSYGSAGGPDGGHLALNYWFHPPDNLDPSRRGFRAPYSSDFWPSLWRTRVSEGLPGGLEPGGIGAQPPPSAAAADADGGDLADGEHGAVVGDANGEAKGDGKVAAAAGRHGGGKRSWQGLPSAAVANGDVDDASEQQPQESLGGAADGDGDLDPPRRQRPAAAARALVAKLAAMGAGGSGGGGETKAQLSEEEYQLLMAMEAARRRNAAIHAMRGFFEKQMKLQRYRQMRSRLPPGRRHHPVVPISAEARNWRPMQLLTPSTTQSQQWQPTKSQDQQQALKQQQQKGQQQAAQKLQQSKKRKQRQRQGVEEVVVLPDKRSRTSARG